MPDLALTNTSGLVPVQVVGSVPVVAAVPAWSTGQNADVDLVYEPVGAGAVTQGGYFRNAAAAQQILTFSSDGATDGFTLRPGEWSPFIPFTNLNQVHVKSSAVNCAVEWVAW